MLSWVRAAPASSWPCQNLAWLDPRDLAGSGAPLTTITTTKNHRAIPAALGGSAAHLRGG